MQSYKKELRYTNKEEEKVMSSVSDNTTQLTMNVLKGTLFLIQLLCINFNNH